MILPGLKEPKVHMAWIVPVLGRIWRQVDISAVAFDTLGGFANARLSQD
jgi:hypothetical protein